MTREEAYNRIDAIIAKHEIDDEYVTITNLKDYDAFRIARKTLEQEPKTGHWIDIMVGDMPAQACDRCNTFYPLTYTGGGHKYCPNCGAKMIKSQGGEE